MWTWLVPALSLGILAVAGITGVGALLASSAELALLGTVVAAVHHAEVIAHRVGEPFGTLVLALAVTIIEASLILSMMIAGGEDMATLPRDTIYAATMIICNGVVGICLLVGGLAHREQTFRVEGSGAGMAALIAMSVLTLALPAFTTTTLRRHLQHLAAFVPRGDVGCAVGRVRVHPDGFPSRLLHSRLERSESDEHAEPPTARAAWLSFAVLLLALVTVVGLAKALSPSIEPRSKRPARRAPWSGSSSPCSSCCRRRGRRLGRRERIGCSRA